MKIQCVSCKRIIAETTDKFKPDDRPNGSMLQLVEPYKSRGWALDMNWTNSTCCAELFCPECEYPLAPSGRFNLIPPEVSAPTEFSVPSEDPVSKVEIPAPDGWVAGKRLTAEEEKLVLVKQTPEVCKICGRAASEFKSRAGFIGHQNHCKGV